MIENWHSPRIGDVVYPHGSPQKVGVVIDMRRTGGRYVTWPEYRVRWMKAGKPETWEGTVKRLDALIEQTARKLSGHIARRAACIEVCVERVDP